MGRCSFCPSSNTAPWVSSAEPGENYFKTNFLVSFSKPFSGVCKTLNCCSPFCEELRGILAYPRQVGWNLSLVCELGIEYVGNKEEKRSDNKECDEALREGRVH